MPDAVSVRKVMRFGEFEVDLRAGSLRKQGVNVRLRHQLLVALSALLEREGEVVTREELQRRLWPGDVFVDFEVDLNTIIARLREALGDSAENPRFIETAPKRGYRFSAPIEVVATEPLSERRVRLAVLPFSNVSGDPAEEFFSDSMTEEIITSLCQIAPENLAVIARTTAMHYKNCEKDVAQIARELGADYVVEGGVRRGGERVIMNVQLIKAEDQAHVFAEKYDAEMRDVFGLHGRIADDVAKHIPSLSGAIDRGHARKKPTEDLEAYQSYLQGRHHMYKLTPDRLGKAKLCFKDAISRDPEFALAYDALGESDWWMGFFGYLPPKQASFEGLGAVLTAVEIDPSLAETHALLGQFRQKVGYKWPEVRREMMVAKKMDPSSPLVMVRYAVSYLLPHAQLEEAIAEVERGLEFDPLSWLLHCWLCIFLWLARDYGMAMREAQVFRELDPDNYIPYLLMGDILRDSGRFEESIAPQRRAVALSGGAPPMLGWLGMNLALSGNAEEARSLLDRIRDIAGRTYVSPTSFVWVHVGLKEYDEAFHWMDRAIDERDSMIIPIKTYAYFDPMRADPRFPALLRKMNLEP